MWTSAKRVGPNWLFLSLLVGLVGAGPFMLDIHKPLKAVEPAEALAEFASLDVTDS
jgi:hypothetical protein